jgi:hypothetical protein
MPREHTGGKVGIATGHEAWVAEKVFEQESGEWRVMRRCAD